MRSTFFAWPYVFVISLAAHAAHSAASTSQSTVSSLAPTTVSNNITTEAATKPQVIATLNGMLQRNIQALNLTDQSIRDIAIESSQISLRASDQVAIEKQLRSIPERLLQLQNKREELRLRRDFLTRLSFHVDSHWTGQPFAGFLEKQLVEMAIADLTSNNPNDTTQGAQAGSLAKFCIYLSIAIREIPEPREDMVAFLSGYMEFSSVRNPRSPIAYAESRHYTNGSSSQTARPVDKQNLSIAVEQRMKELGLSQDQASSQAISETPQRDIHAISPQALDSQKQPN